MKILLVGNYLRDSQMSMKLFAEVLAEGLKNYGHDVRLIRPQPVFGPMKEPAWKGLGKWLGYADKFIIFPFYLKKMIAWADIIHICDHSNAVYTVYLKRKKHIVTCHDLLAVRSALGEIDGQKSDFSGRQFQNMILNGLNHARYVACDSESTKNDLLRLSQLGHEKVSVIYNGLNYSYTPMNVSDARKRLGALGITCDNPFILHVGNNNWYKNKLGVMQIFRSLISFKETSQFHLVTVGFSLPSDVRKYVKDHHLEEKVFELTNVAGEDLCALYSVARALVFPSFYEGFGLPIIEAQACGCPVFTSNRPPMTEVGGEGAIYFNPSNPIEAAQIIVQSFSNGTAQKSRETGFKNCEKYSRERMINNYERLYQEICND
jgi:glycosyltransferase involved in cell wall biosynthesis